MNEFNYDNEVIEIDNDNSNNDVIEELYEKESKKQKKSLKDKWHNLSKKKKVLIIVIPIIIILLVASLLIYFFILKKDEEDTPKEDPVILEKDNYRYENGSLIFLDKQDRELGRYTCTNKDIDKCLVAKVDYSKDKFERIKSVYETDEEIEKSSQIYLDNYVFVKDGEEVFLYNIKENDKVLEDLSSIKIYNTSKNYVVIQNIDDVYGLIEINEEGYKYLIRPSYDYLGIVNNELNYLVALDKKDTYIIDSSGKKLSDNISGNIESCNNKYIVVSKNDKYNLYNYKNEELLSDYNYIGLNNDVISLVNSNRLYLVDNDLNKLNADGIKLNNNYYVKEYVYDKDNKLVDTLVSYEISVKDGMASVTVGKDNTVINMYEGIVSSNYDFISYYDGKLYFYGDVDKADLLGTYTCTNKNTLNKDSKEFNNCNLYNTTEGISGIYNNRYVFVEDGGDSSEKIYLYDIKTKKNKGTYSYLDFTTEGEFDSQVKPIYATSSYVIARSATGSNSGNFGVLEITSDTVSGKVPFSYKNITSNGEYFLLVSKDDSYSVYDTTFTKISNEFAFIKLYDKYYAGVNNDKLNIYSYDDTKSILDNDLDVTNNEFEITFTSNKVKITINSLTYEYNLDGTLVG